MSVSESTRRNHLVNTQRLICAGYVHFQRYFEWSDRKASSDDIDEGRKLMAMANIEISSLISTMGQLRRWLLKLSCDEIISSNISAPLSEVDDLLKDVRDMREHLDDYHSGKGRNRARFLHRFVAPDGRIYAVAPDWIFHFQGKAYLGGRVALEDVARALKHAADALEPVWELPWRPLDLCAMVKSGKDVGQKIGSDV